MKCRQSLVVQPPQVVDGFLACGVDELTDSFLLGGERPRSQKLWDSWSHGREVAQLLWVPMASQTPTAVCGPRTPLWGAEVGVTGTGAPWGEHILHMLSPLPHQTLELPGAADEMGSVGSGDKASRGMSFQDPLPSPRLWIRAAASLGLRGPQG